MPFLSKRACGTEGTARAAVAIPECDKESMKFVVEGDIRLDSIHHVGLGLFVRNAFPKKPQSFADPSGIGIDNKDRPFRCIAEDGIGGLRSYSFHAKKFRSNLIQGRLAEAVDPAFAL